MGNGNNKKVNKNSERTPLRVAVNVLSAVLAALVALLFAVYGFKLRVIKFIAEHYALLTSLSVLAIGLLLIAYITFFILDKQSIFRLIFCTFVCLDICAVVFFALSYSGVMEKLTSIAELRDYIAGFGGTAIFIFILFQFLQVVVLPIPGSVSVGVGVALFGPLKCAIFSFIGILSGSVVAFFIGRVIGYKAVCWIVGKDDLDKWLNKIKGKDYLLLSIMFLLPLFPDDVLCFVAGLSSMTWVYFLLMITITRAISVFSTAYSLDLIPFNTWWGLLIWAVIIAGVIALFVYVCKYSDKIDKFIKNKLKINPNKSK